jgi:hypothetical protein
MAGANHREVRVIAGTLKGRVLLYPAGVGVRPTMQRTKASVFDSLARRIPGSVFVDLYAGAGGVGRLGLGSRLVLQHSDHGIDLRIDLVQASKDGVDRLARRGLSGADQSRQVGRVVLPKLHRALAQFFFDSVPKKIMLPSRSATSKSRSP